MKVRHFAIAALGVAWRNLRTGVTTPSLLLPPLVAPLVLFAVFAGGLSKMGRLEPELPGGYLTFQFVWILLQAAAFGGLFAGVGAARDLESGFAYRLMLAVPNRRSLLVGYLLGSLGRALIGMGVVFAVGVAVGVRIDEVLLGIGGVAVLGLLVSTMAALWATGVAFRQRGIRALPLMRLPVFLGLFLTPAFMPLELLAGWLRAAAVVNPVTYVLNAGRQLIVGQTAGTTSALVATAATLAFLVPWALSGLRRAETEEKARRLAIGAR